MVILLVVYARLDQYLFRLQRTGVGIARQVCGGKLSTVAKRGFQRVRMSVCHRRPIRPLPSSNGWMNSRRG